MEVAVVEKETVVVAVAARHLQRREQLRQHRRRDGVRARDVERLPRLLVHLCTI